MLKWRYVRDPFKRPSEHPVGIHESGALLMTSLQANLHTGCPKCNGDLESERLRVSEKIMSKGKQGRELIAL